MTGLEILLLVVGMSIITGLASHNATKNRIKIVEINHFKIDDTIYTIHQGIVHEFLVKGFYIAQDKNIMGDSELIKVSYTLYKKIG